VVVVVVVVVVVAVVVVSWQRHYAIWYIQISGAVKV
jgi:hypothetical protein